MGKVDRLLKGDASVVRKVERTLKYSDDEARDERGRWTTSGTGHADFGGAKTGDLVNVQHFPKNDPLTTSFHQGTVDGYSKNGTRLHFNDGYTIDRRQLDNQAPDSPKDPVRIISSAPAPSTMPEIDRATYGNSGAERRWARSGGPPSLYD